MLKIKFPAGMQRWYYYQVIKIIIAFVFSIQIGLIIFKFYAHLMHIPKFWQIFHIVSDLKYFSYLKHKFFLSNLVGFSITVILTLLLIIKRNHADNSVLGDAHFASPCEIKKGGFFEKEGIIVGKTLGVPIRSGGFEHVLAFAPAGSGKTTSIAIPNLLTWRESCVVNDPKYELFETTSGYRKKAFKNDVFLWAPTRTKTHRYNPLQFISEDHFKRIGEIQLISHVIIPNGKGEPIWYQSSRELFLALVLYLIDNKTATPTLPSLYALSKRHHFNEWLTNLVENTIDYDPEFYRNASSYLNTAEKTRASILKTFTGYLEIFANPVINAAVGGSDFDLRDLRKKKMTIYIGFSENEKEMISPLFTIFWQQLISFMTEETPKIQTEPYALLCLMEEFSILGRLVNLKSSLKILRGYRVRVLIIIQYLAQVLEYYSQAEAEAFKNIKTKIVFAPDSQEDAEYVSKILGVKTERVTNRSATQGSNNNTSSRSDSLQAIPLMRPDAIQRLKDKKALVIRTGHAPVMANQYRWYKQKELKNLPRSAVLIPTQTPVIIPFERENSIEDAPTKFQVNTTIDNFEIEKMKIQAEFISGAVLNALNSENSDA